MRSVHGIGFKKDGINKHEFVLLSAVRLGYMDPDTIGLICKKFDSFGSNGEVGICLTPPSSSFPSVVFSPHFIYFLLISAIFFRNSEPIWTMLSL